MTGQTACGIRSSRARGTTYEEISFSLSIIEHYRPLVLCKPTTSLFEMGPSFNPVVQRPFFTGGADMI